MSLPEFQTRPHFLVRFEWPLVLIVLSLTSIGLALIYSATLPMGKAGQALVVKQMVWFSLAIVLTAAFLFLDYRVLERWAWVLYVFIVLGLVAVWAAGSATAGSKRWIELWVMRFQPSEFAKLAVVMIVAKYCQDRLTRGDHDPADLVKPVLLVALPVVLILIQPDLGTAGIVLITSVSMILFAGLHRKALIWAGGLIIAAVPVLILLGDRLLKGYQKQRLLTYFFPDNDPTGAGYHILQSQIAIGSGGLFGKGFLQGTQNQLKFLPVKHTDFIFSILAEEIGFLGCLAVLLLFALLFLRGLAITGNARDSFGALVAFGCTALLFWHVTINVGMAMGLLPVVGVPLIFLSYGGSSLVASFLAVAIMVNVSMRRFSY